jgi:hypothetical protein
MFLDFEETRLYFDLFGPTRLSIVLVYEQALEPQARASLKYFAIC